jgi:hypothetical protein
MLYATAPCIPRLDFETAVEGLLNVKPKKKCPEK